MTDEARRVARFALIGLASTVFYFVLLVALRPFIRSTMLLTAACYSSAMGFNFLAQGLFAFRAQRLSHQHLGRYLVMQGSAFVANSLAMSLLVDRIGIPLLLSQVSVLSAIAVCTYLVSKMWVFR